MLPFSNTSLNDALVPADSEKPSAKLVTLPKQTWQYFLVLSGLGLLILGGWLISAIVYQFTGWQKFEEQRSLFTKSLLVGAGLVLFGLGPNLIRRLPYWRSRLRQYRLQSYRKRLSWIYQFSGQFLPPKYRLNPDQVFANVTPTWGLTLIIYSLNDFHNLLWLEEARRKAEASGLEAEITSLAPTEISLTQEANLWGKCLSQPPCAEWVSKLSEYSLPVAAVPPLEVTNLEIMARYYLKLARLIQKELAQAGVNIPTSFGEVRPSNNPPELPTSFTEIQPAELSKSFNELQTTELPKSLNNGVQASDFLESLNNGVQASNFLEGLNENQPSNPTEFPESLNEVQTIELSDFLKSFEGIQLTNLVDQGAFSIEEIRLVADEEIKLV